MSEDLFKLVNTLTKAEKKLLRIQGTSKDGKSANYLLLLDELLAMPSYDEHVLTDKFAGSAMLGNFSVAKSYLYRSILKACLGPALDSSVEAGLRRNLDEVEYLFSKNLITMAEKALAKGLEIAEKAQLPNFVADLLRWKRRLLNKQPRKDQLSLLLDLEQEELGALEALQLDARLRSLRARQLAVFSEKVNARTAETKAKLKEILEHPDLAKAGLEGNFHTFQNKCMILFSTHWMLGNLPDAFGALKEALQAWQSKPELKELFPDQFLQVLVSFSDVALSMRQVAHFQASLALLKDFDGLRPSLNLRARVLRLHLELRFALISGNFLVAIEPGLSAAHLIGKHGPELGANIVSTLLFDLCSYHFLREDFLEAREIVNQIAKKGEKWIRQDIEEAANLLLLAMRLDMNELDEAEAQQRRLDRRLKRAVAGMEFENLLVQGFKRYHLALPSDQQGVLQALLGQLEGLPAASNLTGRAEILLWLKSKVLKQPIKVLLKEKFADEIRHVQELE